MCPFKSCLDLNVLKSGKEKFSFTNCLDFKIVWSCSHVFFLVFKCSDWKGMGYFNVFKLQIWSNAVHSQSFFCVKVGIFVIFVNIWWENFKFYRDAHSNVVYIWIFWNLVEKNYIYNFFLIWLNRVGPPVRNLIVYEIIFEKVKNPLYCRACPIFKQTGLLKNVSVCLSISNLSM